MLIRLKVNISPKLSFSKDKILVSLDTEVFHKVSDLRYMLINELQIKDMSIISDLYLSLDGYDISPTSNIDILRDNDVITVEISRSTQLKQFMSPSSDDTTLVPPSEKHKKRKKKDVADTSEESLIKSSKSHICTTSTSTSCNNIDNKTIRRSSQLSHTNTVFENDKNHGSNSGSSSSSSTSSGNSNSNSDKVEDISTKKFQITPMTIPKKSCNTTITPYLTTSKNNNNRQHIRFDQIKLIDDKSDGGDDDNHTYFSNNVNYGEFKPPPPTTPYTVKTNQTQCMQSSLLIYPPQPSLLPLSLPIVVTSSTSSSSSSTSSSSSSLSEVLSNVSIVKPSVISTSYISGYNIQTKTNNDVNTYYNNSKSSNIHKNASSAENSDSNRNKNKNCSKKRKYEIWSSLHLHNRSDNISKTTTPSHLILKSKFNLKVENPAYIQVGDILAFKALYLCPYTNMPTISSNHLYCQVMSKSPCMSQYTIILMQPIPDKINSTLVTYEPILYPSTWTLQECIRHTATTYSDDNQIEYTESHVCEDSICNNEVYTFVYGSIAWPEMSDIYIVERVPSTTTPTTNATTSTTSSNSTGHETPTTSVSRDTIIATTTSNNTTNNTTSMNTDSNILLDENIMSLLNHKRSLLI